MGSLIDIYLPALLAPFSELLGLSKDIVIQSRKLPDVDRLKFANSVVDSLCWTSIDPLVCGYDGIIGRLHDRRNRQTLVFIYRYDSCFRSSALINACAAQLGLSSPEWPDPFFFFCIKNLGLPIAPGHTRASAIPRLKIQRKKSLLSVDYHGVLSCYGNFHVFIEQDNALETTNFVNFILGPHGTKHLIPTRNHILRCFSEKAKFPSGTLHFDDVSRKMLSPVTDVINDEIDLIVAEPTRLLRYLREVNVDKSTIIANRAGGLIFQFSRLVDNVRQDFLVVSVSSFNDEERIELIDYLLTQGLNNQDFDADLFASLCYHVQDLGQLNKNFLSGEALKDSLYSTGKLMFSLSNVENFYEAVLICKKEADFSTGIWEVVTNLALRFRRFRSPFISPKIIGVAAKIVTTKFDRHENIYLSVTGAHWKHVFLEVYRILERLHFFGTMFLLKKEFNLSLSEFEMHSVLSKRLSWKGTDHDSVMNLFEVVPKEVFDGINICSIPSIELTVQESDSFPKIMRKFATKTYEVRNTGVHLGELTGVNNVIVSAEGWPILIECLYRIVYHLYEAHISGMPPVPDGVNLSV